MNQVSFNRFKPTSHTKEFEVVTAENRNHKRRIYTPMGQDEADQRNRNEFRSWRANWRKGYKRLVATIKLTKEEIKNKDVDESVRREAASNLQMQRAIARSMMMALESTKQLYRIEHGTEFSRNNISDNNAGHSEYLDLAKDIVTRKETQSN